MYLKLWSVMVEQKYLNKSGENKILINFPKHSIRSFTQTAWKNSQKKNPKKACLCSGLLQRWLSQHHLLAFPLLQYAGRCLHKAADRLLCSSMSSCRPILQHLQCEISLACNNHARTVLICNRKRYWMPKSTDCRYLIKRSAAAAIGTFEKAPGVKTAGTQTFKFLINPKPFLAK